MKKVAIQSATFSAEGRFTGKNAAGQRFYVGASLLAPLGITSETPIADIAFPMFILCEEETHTDKEGLEFTRWDAKSAYATMDAMLEASIADQVLDVLADAKLAAIAKGAGLNQQTLQARVAASV